MTPKQEEALRDYLQEVIVPLIEEVLVKKLGQAMTFAKKELPQRTWVGLTEDEVALIAADCSLVTPSDFYFYQAIEAKLKEKNT